MNRDEIVAALAALGETLDRRGVQGERGDRLDSAARFFVEERFGGDSAAD